MDENNRAHATFDRGRFHYTCTESAITNAQGTIGTTLLTVTPVGSSMARPLHWDAFDGPMTDWDAYGPPRTYIDNGFLVPDGVGGLLSSFMDAASTSHHIRRIEDSGYTDYAMPSGTNALAMVGDDATGYFLSASLDGVTAADTRNGAPKWTVTGALWSLPVATNLGGGIDMFDGTTLTVLDGEGQPVSTHSVPVAGFELWHSPSSETFIGMAECCEYTSTGRPGVS